MPARGRPQLIEADDAPAPALLEDLALGHRAAQAGPDDLFDNRLIHGDNLAVLRALGPEFAGRVQCVYIDPPYNTGQVFAHYDDGVEHDRWLALMRQRLLLLHRLLTDSGTLFVHIDDNELAYLITVADEVFGRANRIAVITFKQSSVSGPKAVNAGFVSTASFIVVYARRRAAWRPGRVHAATARDARYTRWIDNIDDPPERWRLVPLRQAFARARGLDPKSLRGGAREAELEAFVLDAPHRVVRTARIAARDVGEPARQVLARSAAEPGVVLRAERPGREDMYFLGGEQLIFYSAKVREVDGRRVTAQALSTIWDDLLPNNLHKEGGVEFSHGKKPELLLKRCLDVATAPGDLVLDCFAGSGTTAAVAHKMRRRWLAVELGPHAETHCLPRLRAVVDGDDRSGATAATGWRGGGGFRFFRLAGPPAPSAG
ncbi:site-specific DNA-methyltransferase [Nannocystis pusilla]|uniref:site-specific DNA-methyltransferase n=1 Tax=Nannocystis pusilla TaxID=889268 RepID=UPI003BF2691E